MSCWLRAYQPTQTRWDKVKTWPVPKNIKGVQSFLGLASYYRHFIPHFAKKAQSLHELVGPTASKPKNRTKARSKETQAAEAIPIELEPKNIWMDDCASGGIWCTEGGTLYFSSFRVSQFQQGVYTGDWCLIKRFRHYLVSTAKGQEHPCNYLCKPIFMPIWKINAQLQFSQTGTTHAKMGCNWKFLRLFVRLVISSLHG